MVSSVSVYTILLFLLFNCFGCATNRDAQLRIPKNGIELKSTPFFAQESYQCGPASLAMLLGTSGIDVGPETLVPMVYLPKRRGSLQVELLAASRRYGRIPYVIEPSPQVLVDELNLGKPVLILQNLGLKTFPVYHYSVVIGVQEDGDFILRSGTNRRLVTSRKVFAAQWGINGYWGMILLRPGEFPAVTNPEGLVKAIYDFERAGNGRDSIKAYKTALLRWPRNQALLFALGNNYLHLQDYIKAEKTFRSLLDLSPNHLGAANNLAETLVRLGRFQQAYIMISEAMKLAEKLESPLQQVIKETKREIEEKDNVLK